MILGSVKTLLLRVFDFLPAKSRAKFLAWWHAPSYPRILQIELNFRCNLKCVMCGHGNGFSQDIPDLTLDLFRKTLDEFAAPESAAGRALKEVNLQGVGEPMLNKDTLDMVRYAKSLNLGTFFVSNMTVLTDNIAEELVRAGHDWIIVSVDSIDRDVFQDIRRGVTFNVLDKVFKNITRLQEVKKRLGATKPEIHVNSIMMKHTVHQAPELVAKLKSLGVNYITFVELVTAGIRPDTVLNDGSRVIDQSLMTLPPEEVAAIHERIKALDTPECRVVIVQDWTAQSRAPHDGAVMTCEDLWIKPFVTVEGIMTPCCYLPNPKFSPMGDLKQQSFEDIWFGDRYQAFRKSHIEGRAPDFCQKCPQFVKTIAQPSRLRGSSPPPNPVSVPVFLGDGRFTDRIRTKRPASPALPSFSGEEPGKLAARGVSMDRMMEVEDMVDAAR